MWGLARPVVQRASPKPRSRSATPTTLLLCGAGTGSCGRPELSHPSEAWSRLGPPGRGPSAPPHLHAGSPGIDPRVQDGDEHPAPVILRVAAQEGGGPGLFLRQKTVEREGLLGGGGGHGRKLEDGRGRGKLPGCSRNSGSRTPGDRGPEAGRGRGQAASTQSLAVRDTQPIPCLNVS